ncbi:DNA-binding transcriptional regulator, AcrR family [Micromonospora pallida]|uniref:DNA-binding transcriptional regulator, AcrR family n=1 Tax=Micromonospora pallida TaxID=145854 RepID=A0A1C6RWZ7_9ACTN|nr:TetR family transcriptional regulator C-terminal domain-containing protein [Micromonospora pallida]SCL21739.1 DNA-binding transcriptional regulator, AcrR family [Micromonospora pallida]
MARRRDLQGHQERLSTATWSVLADHGLPGLTLRAVAERAGCSTGLVLHTFPDKQALLVHARTLLHERTAARADAAQASGPEPLDALRAVLMQVASGSDDKREEARVWVGFLAAALADPELARLHQSHNRAFVGRIQRLVATCRPDWSPEQTALSATALVALVEGLNVLAAVDLDTYSAAAQQAAIEAALDQIRAERPAPPPADPAAAPVGA